METTYLAHYGVKGMRWKNRGASRNDQYSKSKRRPTKAGLLQLGRVTVSGGSRKYGSASNIDTQRSGKVNGRHRPHDTANLNGRSAVHRPGAAPRVSTKKNVKSQSETKNNIPLNIRVLGDKPNNFAPHSNRHSAGSNRITRALNRLTGRANSSNNVDNGKRRGRNAFSNSRNKSSRR